jgi:transposase
LPRALQALQAAYPEDTVELWTVDQHRIGLKPILRRIWCRRGQRPKAVVQHRHQWCYLYAFVHPPSGRTVWLLLPTVSIAAFTVALSEFAQAVGTDRGKQLLLVCDGAGWHVSPQVQVPAGIHLHVLPPYSPELQPAECLWPLTNEALANRHFQDLDELQEVQAQRCLTLQAMPEVIRAHTNFHWWPQIA